MTTLNFTRFSGIIPRVHRAKLGASYAAEAHDVDLRHGTLRPWREPKAIEGVPTGTKTVHQYGCCWFSWDKCVEVAEYSSECPRLYVTGSHPYPVVTNIDAECNIGCGGQAWTRLGVPAPKSPPTVTAPTAVEDYTMEATEYVYTYVNCFCEEGAPSPPSVSVDRNDVVGFTTTIKDFLPVASEYNIEKVNIYRRTTGRMYVREQATDKLMTDFMYVGSIDLSIGIFQDAVRNINIGHTLNSRFAHEPPVGLRGMMLVNNSNTLAGFLGNKLYFSNNNAPHAWSQYNEITLDDNIRMIRPLGKDIAVMTDGYSYIVQGVGDCSAVNGCRAVAKSEYPFPTIVCCSHNSSVETPMGVIYVTSRGLALMAEGNPTPALVSMPWFAEDDWRKMKPETMRLGYYDGAVFCTSDTYSFMLQLDGSTYKNDQIVDYLLTTFSDVPVYYFRNRHGELFMLEGDVVYQWNAGSVYRPFIWESKLIDTREFNNFRAMQVNSYGFTNFSLLVDDTLVYNRDIRDQTDYRIPHYGRKRRHVVRLSGIHEVWGLSLAGSFRELGGVGD